MECRLCGSSNIHFTHSIGETYIADTFCSTKHESKPKYKYDLWTCLNCYHLQSFDVLPQNLLFGETYTYRPGYSTGLRKGFEEYIKKLQALGLINAKSVLIDIGSNDGLFLDCAKKIVGCSILGVEPAKMPREYAVSNGINTIDGFWGEAAVNQIINETGGKVDIISANNVFAHCSDLRSFAHWVSELLKEGGFFVFEISYLLRILQRDLIGVYFHEHLSHHSLISLRSFLKQSGLNLIDAFETESQGGSIVGIAQKTSMSTEASKNVFALLQEEYDYGLGCEILIEKVKESFQRARLNYSKALSFVESGSKMAIFGASRSLTTFDAVFNITQDIECIYDDNLDKVGKFYPESDIKVCATEEMAKDKPDGVIIAAWVPTEKIIHTLKDQTKARFAIRLLDPINYCDILHS